MIRRSPGGRAGPDRRDLPGPPGLAVASRSVMAARRASATSSQAIFQLGEHVPNSTHPGVLHGSHRGGAPAATDDGDLAPKKSPGPSARSSGRRRRHLRRRRGRRCRRRSPPGPPARSGGRRGAPRPRSARRGPSAWPPRASSSSSTRPRSARWGGPSRDVLPFMAGEAHGRGCASVPGAGRPSRPLPECSPPVQGPVCLRWPPAGRSCSHDGLLRRQDGCMVVGVSARSAPGDQTLLRPYVPRLAVDWLRSTPDLRLPRGRRQPPPSSTSSGPPSSPSGSPARAGSARRR